MARTYCSDEQKKRIVREALETCDAAAEARRHEITPNLIYRWIKLSLLLEEDGKVGIRRITSQVRLYST